MAAKAPGQVPPGGPSSHISDGNDGDGSHDVPRPGGVDNTAPTISGEESTSGFSLPHLLRSLFPQVSLVLENTGSVARDHLANERTWLAYVRTSLSIAGTGVGVSSFLTS